MLQHPSVLRQMKERSQTLTPEELQAMGISVPSEVNGSVNDMSTNSTSSTSSSDSSTNFMPLDGMGQMNTNSLPAQNNTLMEHQMQMMQQYSIPGS